MKNCRDDRCGFTLLEMIVVVGIIGVLVGLLLPAIQHVRESANRTSCANNLRQFGLAIHAHVAEHGGLPTLGHYPENDFRPFTPNFVDTGWVLERNDAFKLTRAIPAPPRRQLGGWGYQLLPFLEQSSLHAGGNSRGFYHPANEQTRPLDVRAGGIETILSTPLRVFACPSRGGARVHTLRADSFQSTFGGSSGIPPMTATTGQVIWLHSPDQSVQVAQTDYAANGASCIGDRRAPLWYTGHVWPDPSENPRLRRRIAPLRTLKTIRDGLAQTVLIGEKIVNRAKLSEPSTYDMYGYATGYNSSNVRFCGGPRPFPFLTPQQDYGNGAVSPSIGFGSAHRSATLFTFADGSVRAVSHDVDGEIFFALCVVGDGRLISESDYE